MNKGIRVLLVDDEERFVSNLAKLLRDRGFDITTAFDGFTAVDLIKGTGGFDVVVLDVKMPGMDGIETLRQIKKLAPGIQVIMLTGHADITSGTEAMREGGFDYFLKPCDIEVLTAGIIAADKLERIKRRPILWPRTRVGEIILCTFKRLYPEDLLSKALELYNFYKCVSAVETLYVVDDKNRLQGLVAKQDIVNSARKSNSEICVDWDEIVKNPHLLPSTKIGAIMRPKSMTVHPDDLISDVARQMIADKFRSLPVVKDEVVMGVVRMQDVLLYND
ncbi:MAG: response regulator [Deltaproteobacteria bacterium]|nr:response regulator [Deltaproteobacteria bacterium]